MRLMRDTDNWYFSAIQQIKHFANCAISPLEKVRAFNYAMFVIRTEYIAQAKARIFHKEFPHIIPFLFPTKFYNENGAEYRLDKEEQQRKVSLSGNVAVTAWESSRLSSVLSEIFKNGFSCDDNHKANYYTEIELTTVYSGNHSASAGIFLKSGHIYADVYDISKLFDHVDTDGLKWINHYTKKPLDDVSDIHIAVLYETARMKYEYMSGFDLDTAYHLRSHAEIFRKDTDYYTVICGITGTGKSSFMGAMSADSLQGGFILPHNYDHHALELLFEKHENIIEESSFIMGQTIVRVREAKKRRYYVKMYYISVDNVDECIRRASNNPAGSEFDEHAVRYSFAHRFKHLFAILPYCDEVEFYDNLNGFKKVAKYHDRNLIPTGNAYPDWFLEMQSLFLESYDNIVK